jgi:hypothetical protein
MDAVEKLTLDETVAKQRVALAELAMKGALAAWRETSKPGTPWRLHEANVIALQAAYDRYQKDFERLIGIRNMRARACGTEVR